MIPSVVNIDTICEVLREKETLYRIGLISKREVVKAYGEMTEELEQSAKRMRFIIGRYDGGQK